MSARMSKADARHPPVAGGIKRPHPKNKHTTKRAPSVYARFCGIVRTEDKSVKTFQDALEEMPLKETPFRKRLKGNALKEPP